jgi:PilZ domain
MNFRTRQDRRDKILQPAWISVGDDRPLRNCIAIDISNSGAKLALEYVDELPDKFSLWMSRHGDPRYTCRIAWREQTTIGVEFLHSPQDRHHSGGND